MLTDIFAERYYDTPLSKSYDERKRRFMVQSRRIITEQLFPYYVDGKENSEAKSSLEAISSKLSMEFGTDHLSPLYSGTYRNTPLQVITTFMQFAPTEFSDADYFIKQRISFVELAFREFEKEVKTANASLPEELKGVNQSYHDYFIWINDQLNEKLRENVYEINERLRQATFPLTYHNGFIQFSDDPFVNEHVKQPFWQAIAHSKWENVEMDMLEAIDRRDNRRAEAALSAAKALESTIKIIAHDRNATTGNERGAVNFIEGLAAERGGKLIATWEANVLKNFFGEVRNKLGHGPGTAQATVLSKEQDDWAIETCMSWIKSLVNRLQ
ncbi:hypothetical protein ATU3B_12700 [Agrobacterium genomosp. 3 str. CIP 111-78]|uniref:AbiJ-NTD4 domain-containing protein n=1 Tax=Agrobacterium tumefaciens complex TaxID=1183400 RepID=UPI001586D4AA|nr:MULTISPECIES: hypothetical protein [Agrobacterium tumefaciens complex]MCA2372483.1 hypothetical protein [Agrobacterium tomkonis CIP 111-78]